MRNLDCHGRHSALKLTPIDDYRRLCTLICLGIQPILSSDQPFLPVFTTEDVPADPSVRLVAPHPYEIHVGPPETGVFSFHGLPNDDSVDDDAAADPQDAITDLRDFPIHDILSVQIFQIIADHPFMDQEIEPEEEPLGFGVPPRPGPPRECLRCRHQGRNHYAYHGRCKVNPCSCRRYESDKGEVGQAGLFD